MCQVILGIYIFWVQVINAIFCLMGFAKQIGQNSHMLTFAVVN